MKKTMRYGIALAVAASVISGIAAEDTDALRKELDALTKRLDEMENQQPEKTSDWTDSIKFKGDLRYRFEYVGEDSDTSKNRQRIRARIGAYADVNDFTTAGLRIRTGSDANSGNQTIGGDFDSKDIYFDLAYMTIALMDGEAGAITLGKMKYPWEVTTDMIWDGDVNPEGIAHTYSRDIEGTGFFSSLGYFKVDDTSSTHDLNLTALQAGIEQPLGDSMKATFGGSYFGYYNAEDFVDPSTDPAVNYVTDFSIVEVFAELGCKELLPVPVKLYGNYVNNVDTGDDKEGYCGGIKFADAKKGKWEAKIGLRRLEANAAPSYYADSDFAGGGTDVKGIRLKTKYNIAKHLQAGFTAISGEQISSGTDVNTIHLDLIAQF